MAKRARVNRKPVLTKQDYEIIAEFRYTLRRFLHFSEQAAVAADLTPQQYQALLAIEGFPGRNRVSIGELAERLQIAHHSAVGLADRLEAAGLVRRAPDQDDRRRVQIYLARRGRTVLEKLYRVHRRELATIGPQIIALLRRLGGRFAENAGA